MLIKPTQHIPAIDRRSTKIAPKKSDSSSEELIFHSLLEEIDIIEISTQEDPTKDKHNEDSKTEADKEKKGNKENNSKLDKFA